MWCQCLFHSKFLCLLVIKESLIYFWNYLSGSTLALLSNIVFLSNQIPLIDFQKKKKRIPLIDFLLIFLVPNVSLYPTLSLVHFLSWSTKQLLDIPSPWGSLSNNFFYVLSIYNLFRICLFCWNWKLFVESIIGKCKN